MTTIEEFLKTRGDMHEKQKVQMGIVYASTLILRNVEATLEPHNLTPSQYNLLLILKRQHPEGVSMQGIVSRLLEKSDVWRLAERLQKAGLIKAFTNKKKDARAKYYRLTEEGLEKLERVAANGSDMYKGVSLISNEEATQFNLLLQKIMQPLTSSPAAQNEALNEVTETAKTLTVPLLPIAIPKNEDAERAITPAAGELSNEESSLYEVIPGKVTIALQQRDEHRKTG